MKRFATIKFLQAFFILAFVLAQVSPACAFVSGKTGSLEVCTEDGTLKTIKVPVRYDLTAFIKKGSPDKNSKHTHHKEAEQCGFCFAHSHLTKTTISSAQITLPLTVTSVLHIGAGSIAYKSYTSIQFQPRAPPTFVA